MHFTNLYVFHRMYRRAHEELGPDVAPPPVKPTQYVEALDAKADPPVEPTGAGA